MGSDSADIIKRDLKEFLKGARCYPFLFIGSGLSIRYAGTRNWSGLLKWLCEEVLGDLSYTRFYNEAKSAVDRHEASSVFPYLATLAEDEINNALLTAEKFDRFRVRNKEKLENGVSPMKLFISDDLSSINVVGNAETAALEFGCSSKLSGVITTNYDFLCETLFPEFDVYVGEQELLLKDPSYSAEIFKIHGSANNPASMILTQADYDELRERQEYLAAKLLTIFLEYPIFFLGYSLQDEDIGSILASIARCVGNSNLNNASKRIVFVSYEESGDSPVSELNMMFGSDALTMTKVSTKDFLPIYQAIAEMETLYDPKFVRQLRKSIVSVASHIDPTSEVVTSGFSQLDNLGENDRVILAFSPIDGEFGKMPTPEDLYYDSLFDDRQFNTERVVSDYLPRLLPGNPGGLPIYKYISNSNHSEFHGTVKEEFEKHGQFDQYLNPTILNSKSAWRRQLKSFSLDGLIDAYGYDKAHEKIGALYSDEIDAEELGEHLSSLVSRNGGIEFIRGNPELKRAIRIYDLLKYRNNALTNEKPPHLSPKCEHPATSEEVDHEA